MIHKKSKSGNLLFNALFLTLATLIIFTFFALPGHGQSEGSDVCDSPVCDRCTTLSDSNCNNCVKFDELDSHGDSWYPHTIDGIKIYNPLFKTDSGTSSTCDIATEGECELIRFDWTSDSENTDVSYSVPIGCLYIKTGQGPHHVHGSYNPDYYFEYGGSTGDTNIAPPNNDNTAISHITFCYGTSVSVNHTPSSFDITQSVLETHLGDQYLPLGTLELSVAGESTGSADCYYQYNDNCLQSKVLYLTEETVLNPANCTSAKWCGYLGDSNNPTTDLPEGTYNTFIDLNRVADEGAPASCSITIRAENDSCS